MNPTDIVGAFQGHHWLLLAMAITLYARKLFSEESQFPISLPKPWLPVISASGGLIYGFENTLASGLGWQTAAIGAVAMAAATGFADAMLVAVFSHGNAPQWARWAVMIFDSFGKTIKPTLPESTKEETKTPPAAMRVRWVRLLSPAFAVTLVFVVSCAAFQRAEPPIRELAACVADSAAKQASLIQIAAECGADIPAVIAALMDLAKAGHPTVKETPAWQEVLSAHRTFAAQDPTKL